jgi:hypothetical protein
MHGEIGAAIMSAARVPPNRGASPTNGMSHIAIAELLDGGAVHWLEQVRDEDNPKAP